MLSCQKLEDIFLAKEGKPLERSSWEVWSFFWLLLGTARHWRCLGATNALSHVVFLSITTAKLRQYHFRETTSSLANLITLSKLRNV